MHKVGAPATWTPHYAEKRPWSRHIPLCTAIYRYIPAKPANPAIKAGGIRFPVLSKLASRRFTRLNGGYSERFANRRAALALWIAFYNFCRVHETLRCTPAMEQGVTDHVWSIGDLIDAALEPSDTIASSLYCRFTGAPLHRALRGA